VKESDLFPPKLNVDIRKFHHTDRTYILCIGYRCLDMCYLVDIALGLDIEEEEGVGILERVAKEFVRRTQIALLRRILPCS